MTHRRDADRIRNVRVPRANLEGLYGSGPIGSPHLYAKDDTAKLLPSIEGSDEPEWQPTLPGRCAASFGLADILVPAR